MLKFGKRIIALVSIIFILINVFTNVYGIENEVSNEKIYNEENNSNNLIDANIQNSDSALLGGIFGGLLGGLLSNADWNVNDDENENNSSYSSVNTSNAIIGESNPIYESYNDSNIVTENTNSTSNYNYEIWYNSLEEYLKTMRLSKDNLKLIEREENKSENITKEYYYVRYEGHIFLDEEYVIYFNDQNKILKATYTDSKYEQLLPNISKLQEKYNLLSSAELKKDLDTKIYDIFDYYNYISSIEKLKEFIKKCEFTKEETEQQIDILDRMYNLYLEDKKEAQPEKKYSKEQIVKIYNELKQEILKKDEEEYNNYLTEMARRNHINKLKDEISGIEEYDEQYVRNMIQNDQINPKNVDNKKSIDSKKVVNEIPNSGSEENLYIVGLSVIVVIAILGIISFSIVRKTKKNSKI